MKNTVKLICTITFLTGLLVSCKKDENKVYFLGGTAPSLYVTSTTPMILLRDDKDKPALTFSWTNPNYMFNTGVSSQDVTYYLQVDTVGANFGSSKLQELAINKDLSVALTVGQLNQFPTRMELSAGVFHNLEFRIKSTLINRSVPLYSGAIKISINNYLDYAVEPPGTATDAGGPYMLGTLWVVGDAVASGWSNPLPAPYDVTQRIARKAPTDVLHYVDTITFKSSGGYKLIQTQGIWSTQYHALDGTAKLSGKFEKKDSDPQFPSPGAGDYRIEVNFQTGEYKLTKL